MKKNSELLCPVCKTGEDMYLLDNRSPFCPYLHCHTGDSCSMFVAMERASPHIGPQWPDVKNNNRNENH